MSTFMSRNDPAVIAKMEANLKTIIAALDQAGFKCKVSCYSGGTDFRAGGQVNVTLKDDDGTGWGNNLRFTAGWKDGTLQKVTSTVRGEKTVTLSASNVTKIVERIQRDRAADIAEDKKRKQDNDAAQAWFDQACRDFKGFKIPAFLKRGFLQDERYRFQNMCTRMSEQKIGTYSLTPDNDVFKNLNANQVKALCAFITDTLPTIK